LSPGPDLYGRIPAAARAAAQGAAALVALGRAAAAAGRRAYRLPADRITVIPQAALPLPRTRQRPSALRALQGSTELVLVPTGIRAVKDPRRAVAALAPLAAQRPQLRLWVAGPALDARYARRLQADLRRHTFARWLGAVPRARFLPYYRAARVILSTSRAEGGPPNALLEAAPAGRPALASDIPAHREFPGAPALFRTDAELRRKLRQLLDDPGAASRLAQQQRRRARARFSLQQEARGWRSLVRRAASQVPVTASGTGSRRRRR
ncbi:MAG: glycosyltransferase, partial [Planctomycetota bacterium]